MLAGVNLRDIVRKSDIQMNQPEMLYSSSDMGMHGWMDGCRLERIPVDMRCKSGYTLDRRSVSPEIMFCIHYGHMFPGSPL